MSSITAEQLGADEFEPGDFRLANLIEPAVEQARSVRELGSSVLLGALAVGEMVRPSYWRPSDAKKLRRA